MAIAFAPGGTAQNPTTTNYLGSLGYVKPEYADFVVKQHRNLLPDLLIATNAMKSMGARNKFYYHFEQSWTYPKMLVTTAGGTGQVTLTLAASNPAQQSTITNQNPPYPTGSPNTYISAINVTKNELIWLQDPTAPTGFTNVITAQVVGTNPALGEVYIRCLNSADTVPTYATATEVPIIGQAATELGGFSAMVVPAPVQYINYIQQETGNTTITKAAAQAQLWFDIDGNNGWQNFQLNNAEQIFKERMYNSSLYGVRASNTTLSGQNLQDEISYTNGMFTEVLANGLPYGYPTLTGFGQTQISDTTLYLDGQRVNESHEWMWCSGISLTMDVSQNLALQFDNGGLIFGQFNGDDSQLVNFKFNRFKWGGHNFNILQQDIFNYAPTTGANGFDFVNEGYILPYGMITTMDEGRVPMMRLRYLGDSLFRSSLVDLETQQISQTAYQLNMFGSIGFEGFGMNGTVYMYQQS